MSNPYASLPTPFTACEICQMRAELRKARTQAEASSAATAPFSNKAERIAEDSVYTPTLSRQSSSSSSSSSSFSSPQLDNGSFTIPEGPCSCALNHAR